MTAPYAASAKRQTNVTAIARPTSRTAEASTGATSGATVTPSAWSVWAMLAMVATVTQPRYTENGNRTVHRAADTRRPRSAKVVALIRMRVTSSPTMRGTVAMNSSYWKQTTHAAFSTP